MLAAAHEFDVLELPLVAAGKPTVRKAYRKQSLAVHPDRYKGSDPEWATAEFLRLTRAKEVLEEAMLEFPGALVLVTHDRFMLERVATELVGLDDVGGAKAVADMSQWMNHLKKISRAERSGVSRSSSDAPARDQVPYR